MALIDRDTVKQELEKAMERNLAIFRGTGKADARVLMSLQYAIAKLDSAPTVDAVPVSYIQQRIDHLHELAEYEFEYNGGYIGATHIAWHELEKILIEWEEERDANQDKTD